MTGFNGPPPPVQGERFPTAEAAWEFYRWGNNSKRYGLPVKIGESGWLCPLPQPIVNAELAAEAAKVGQVSAPPSPGSSIEAAKLKESDRVRIAHEQARLAQKRRQQRDAIEEAERRRLAQPSFDLGGDAS